MNVRDEINRALNSIDDDILLELVLYQVNAFVQTCEHRKQSESREPRRVKKAA